VSDNLLLRLLSLFSKIFFRKISRAEKALGAQLTAVAACRHVLTIALATFANFHPVSN
jgi:hypothetical protein